VRTPAASSSPPWEPFRHPNVTAISVPESNELSALLNRGGDQCRLKNFQKLWSNYGPVIVSQCSETAFGSHPCRGFSISYDRIGCCHGTFGKFCECTGTEGNGNK
jgi:hypothetical protein